MTVGELWPHLRPLCRALALLGWLASAAGMAAGLSIAIAGGTSLSPTMQALELISAISMGVAVLSFIAASVLQPRQRSRRAADSRGADAAHEPAGEFPPTIRSFLLASFALLAGAVVFACAGLVLLSGPSAQSVAFCQVFFLGAAASGFTFMLFSKVTPHRSRN
jgi:hypothetical protein